VAAPGGLTLGGRNRLSAVDPVGNYLIKRDPPLNLGVDYHQPSYERRLADPVGSYLLRRRRGRVDPVGSYLLKRSTEED